MRFRMRLELGWKWTLLMEDLWDWGQFIISYHKVVLVLLWLKLLINFNTSMYQNWTPLPHFHGRPRDDIRFRNGLDSPRYPSHESKFGLGSPPIMDRSRYWGKYEHLYHKILIRNLKRGTTVFWEHNHPRQTYRPFQDIFYLSIVVDILIHKQR